MMTSDKDPAVSFSIFVPCDDMTGNLFIMCQQGISIFVSIRKDIRV